MQVPDDPGGKGNSPDHVIVCPGGDDQTMIPGLIPRRGARCAPARTVRERSGGSRKRKNGTRWLDTEDATLVSFTGEKSARELAKLLGRTELSVYCRLARLNVSSQLKDGYTPRLVADGLHVSRGKLRQWVLDGKLQSQTLYVTRHSIKKLCEKGDTEIVRKGIVIAVLGRPPLKVLETMQRSESKSRQKQQMSHGFRRISRIYTFGRAGRILQVNKKVVNQLVSAGLLKLGKLRIEEDALSRFVADFPSEINWGLVDADTLQWLGHGRPDGETAGEKFPGSLKHLRKVRTCPGCHRSCRGNGYSTHIKFCLDARGLQSEVLEWAADHPKIADRKKPGRLENMDGKIHVGRYSSSSEGSTT